MSFGTSIHFFSARIFKKHLSLVCEHTLIHVTYNWLYLIQSWWSCFLAHKTALDMAWLFDSGMFCTSVNMMWLCSDCVLHCIWYDHSDHVPHWVLLLTHHCDSNSSHLLLVCWWSSLSWAPTKTTHSPWWHMEPQRTFMSACRKMTTTTSEKWDIGTRGFWQWMLAMDINSEWRVRVLQLGRMWF